MNERDTTLSPRCPRCGYDLSGAVDAWRDQCPLEGVCPECGLGNRWRDVLNPSFAIPAWFIENPNTRVRSAYPRTLARCFRPSAFWRTIWMTHPCIAHRLAFFVVASLVSAWALGYALVGAFTEFDVGSGGTVVPLNLLDPISLIALEYRRTAAWAWWVFLWAALTPLGMFALIHTRRVARVRGVHLTRTGAYSIPIIMLLLLLNLSVRAVSAFRYPQGLGWWVRPRISIREQRIWDWVAATEGYVLAMIAGIALCWYWNAVTRRYMRLSQPRATAMIMLLIAGLASLAIVELCSGLAILYDLMLRLADFGFRV